MTIRRLLLSGLIGFFLTGCGYQVADPGILRGISVNIDAPGVDIEVLRVLQDSVGEYGLQAGASPRAALTVHEESYQKWPIAAAAFDQRVQFEVKLEWFFSVKDAGGDSLIDRERIAVVGYFARENQSLLTAHEGELALRAQLRAQASVQLRFRLEAALARAENLGLK